MRFFSLYITLFLSTFIFFSCNKNNSGTSKSSYEIKRRPTAKESFKIEDKFQGKAKTNVTTRKSNKESTKTEAYGELMQHREKPKKKKKKKIVYASYYNKIIEQRKREVALQEQEKEKNPQYSNPAYFGEKKNPRKKNGKIRKKFAKPPYVMNPAFNKAKNTAPSKKKKKKQKK